MSPAQVTALCHLGSNSRRDFFLSFSSTLIIAPSIIPTGHALVIFKFNFLRLVIIHLMVWRRVIGLTADTIAR